MTGVDPPPLDERLGRVLVEGLEPRRVEIVDYDPEWPRRFERWGARLAGVLGATAIRIEHIGSTAVPDLAAKDVVDLLVTVTDADDEASYRPQIERLGLEVRVIEPGHRAFRTTDRAVNLHVWSDDNPEVARYLRFRDRLRDDVDDRALYESAKRSLVGDWPDVNHYAEAKSEVIAAILGRASEVP